MRAGLLAVLLLSTAVFAAAEPSRSDFLAELLRPEATANTSRFGERAAEAFSPEKLALLRALPHAARSTGRELRTLLVIGPNGPRDSYTVLAVVSRGGDLEMTGTRLEGPRILVKGGTQIAPDALGRFVRQLTDSPLIRPGGATPEELEARLAPGQALPERRFDLLLALWSEAGGPVFFFSDLRVEPRSQVRALLSMVNARLRALAPSYPESQNIR